MKKIVLVFLLISIALIGKSQTFSFTKINSQIPNLGVQSADIAGEIIFTDTAITQTVMGITTVSPIVKVSEYGDYKIKTGDIDIRYRFAPIPEYVKETMKDKKGRWIVKEMEFATHVLITDMVDRFTNQHTNISMYLTPKK